jgi:sirohydrochlorin ferrochelatase
VHRLTEVAGPAADPGLGVVLAATGSSRDAANVAVHRLATGLGARHGWHGCLAAFATPVSPSVPEAIARLRAAGARRIAVASWFLAPGLLPTRVADAASTAAVPLAAPLGPHPLVADVVLTRYLTAAAAHRVAA